MSEIRQSRLTVVMPAYNEEGAIEAAVTEVRHHVLDAVPGSELVVVNDGSRDQTGAILDRLAADDARIWVVHQANGGHGRALRTGLDLARGDYVFLVDSDQQIPLEDFARLWQAAAGRHAAFGVRKDRQDPRLRLLLSRAVRRSLRLLFRVRLRDANVPFKVVKRTAWQQARPLIPEDTLTPSLFLAVYLRRNGFDVAELRVRHRARQTGTVSIRRWRLVKFCARGFSQLLGFRWRLRSCPVRRAS